VPTSSFERGPGLCRVRAQLVLLQQAEQRFAPAKAVGDQHRASAMRFEKALQRRERVSGTAIHRERRQLAGGQRGFRSGERVIELGPREALERAEELVLAQEERRRRKQRTVRVAGQQPKARLRVFPELPDGGADVALQADQRLRGQVVGQRRGVVKEQRQVILDAGGRAALGDVLVDAALGGVALDRLAKAGAESGAGRRVRRELACRQQAHLVDLVDAALGVDIERPDGLDLVVEQIDSIRQGAAHREKIDDAATHAVLAGRYHLADMRVSGQRQLLLQAIGREPFAAFEEEGVGGEVGGRRQPVQHRRDRYDEHVAFVATRLVKRCQPFRDQVLVRREVVVRQRFPIREQVGAQLGGEEADLVQDALGTGGVFGDDGERARRLRQAGERQCVCGGLHGR
jgi:hypothetical protein